MSFRNTKFKSWTKTQKIIAGIVCCYLFLSTPIPLIIIGWGQLVWWIVLIGAVIIAAFSTSKGDAGLRYEILHPAVRKYNESCQIVFSKIRTVLKETSYGYGDKWHVLTADVQENKIIAELKLTDNSTFAREVKDKFYLRMTATIRPADEGDSSILQLVFEENSTDKGAENFSAINGIVNSIDAAIGRPQLAAKVKPNPIVERERDLSFIPMFIGFSLVLVFLSSAYMAVHKVNSWVFGIRDSDEEFGMNNEYQVRRLPHR